MIWSITTHIGMAFAVSPSGVTYVVARYSPRGNTLGESPQQETTSGRENNTPTNTLPSYHQPATSTSLDSAQRINSRYGKNPHLGTQAHYNRRRAYENMFGNNEGPLPSPRDSRPSLPEPGTLGRRHVDQVDTEPLSTSGRPPPSSRRMPVSHTDPFRTPYGLAYLHGQGPYGSGAPWSYNSAMPPRGYGGHRSVRSNASLCCTVM